MQASNQPARVSPWKKIRKIFLRFLRLTDEPLVKVYNGYGNKEKLAVFGHVFSLSPLPRKKFRQNIFTNTFSLLRLFMVRTAPHGRLRLLWFDRVIESVVQDDGFFRFEWHPGPDISPGWHPVVVDLLGAEGDIISSGQGLVLLPYDYQYGIISDIDDTFLISHSSNLRKRLFILFTENAHSRRPFEGVIRHYQELATAGVKTEQPNPFFFVSSSEWNLYDYIREFCRKNLLPNGVYLLGQLKYFSQVLNSGQNKHATKFMRIVRVLEAYPQQKFILIGDDSQEDPSIYLSVIEHFPGKIHAVYLRQVHRPHFEKVTLTIEKIKDSGVPCCYFRHSSEALLHSREIGLVRTI